MFDLPLTLAFKRAIETTPCNRDDRTITFYGTRRDGSLFYQSTLYVPEHDYHGRAIEFDEKCMDWIWWRATGQDRPKPGLTDAQTQLRSQHENPPAPDRQLRAKAGRGHARHLGLRAG